jgi:hypothetical protein
MPGSWSATRARTFQDCRRRYYYRYHLTRVARRPDAPPEAVEADRVKTLVGVEAWVGELVHEVLALALNRWRGGRVFGEAEALEHAFRLLSRQYRTSREYWDAPPEAFPSRPVLLDLHYFEEGEELSREQAGALKEKVSLCLREFFRSELAARIRQVGPPGWLPIDRNAAFRLGDLPLRELGLADLQPRDLTLAVRPDFAFREGDYLHIVDWKTGKADADREQVQLTCYMLYAHTKWSQPLPGIVPQIIYLFPEYYAAPAELDFSSLRRVLREIHASDEEIAAAEETSPGEALPPVERFPCTVDTYRCRWCSFRGLCDGAPRREALTPTEDF